MNSESQTSKSGLSWFWQLAIVIAVVGFLIWVSIPNFIGGGPDRLTSVINELRQIDGAKEYWAMQNGFTNGVYLSREITQQDIAPLFVHGDNQDHIDRFGFGFDQNGNIRAGKGVVFSINPLGIRPEAKLTSSFRDKHWCRDWQLPKGTIIRLGTNSPIEFILPGQESQPPKSIEQVLPSR
jgi:hypothetical protein